MGPAQRRGVLRGRLLKTTDGEGGPAVGRSLTALTALQTLILTCNELQTLNITSNHLGAEGSTALGRSLTALTALQTLNLSTNYFGIEGGLLLGDR